MILISFGETPTIFIADIFYIEKIDLILFVCI